MENFFKPMLDPSILPEDAAAPEAASAPQVPEPEPAQAPAPVQTQISEPEPPEPAAPLFGGNAGSGNSVEASTVIKQNDGTAYLVPGIDKAGGILSSEEARAQWEAGGEDYGLFQSEEEARRYRQENMTDKGRAQMRTALLVAKGMDPAQLRKDREIAQRMGLSPWTVHYAYESAADEDLARQIESFDELQEFAARSPAHAAYVKGYFRDMKAIAEWEKRKAEEEQAKRLLEEQSKPGWTETYHEVKVRQLNKSNLETLRNIWALSGKMEEVAADGNNFIKAIESRDPVKIQAAQERLAASQATLAEYQERIDSDSSLLAFLGIDAPLSSAQSSLRITGESLLAALLAGGIVTGGAALLGALGGLGVGAGPAAVASIPAASKTGQAAALLTTFWQTAELEQGLFAADLQRERDPQGKPIPYETIADMARVHGLIAGAIEAIGEKFVFGLWGDSVKSFKLSTREGVRQVTRLVVKNPSMRKQLDVALRGLGIIGANMLKGGVINQVEEGLQETSSVGAELTAKALSNQQSGTKFDTTPRMEHLKRIDTASKWGFLAGLWFGILPGILGGIGHIHRGLKAKREAQAECEFHEKNVEGTKLQKEDPAVTQEYLESYPDKRRTVSIPMQDALRLYNEGTDILSPLGISMEEAQRLAERGHSVDVSLARLHAFLDTPQFNAASQIWINEDGASAQSAQTAGEDFVRIVKQAEENLKHTKAAEKMEDKLSDEQRAALDAEQAKAETALIEVVKGIPNLLGAIKKDGDTGNFAHTVMELQRRSAVMQAAQTGEDPAEVLKRIVVEATSEIRGDRPAAPKQTSQTETTQKAASEHVQENKISETVSGGAPAEKENQNAPAETPAEVQGAQEAAPKPAQEATQNEEPAKADAGGLQRLADRLAEGAPELERNEGAARIEAENEWLNDWLSKAAPEEKAEASAMKADIVDALKAQPAPVEEASAPTQKATPEEAGPATEEAQAEAANAPAEALKETTTQTEAQETAPVEAEQAQTKAETVQTVQTTVKAGPVHERNGKPFRAEGTNGTLRTTGAPEPFKYEVRELADVIPSNDPLDNFRWNSSTGKNDTGRGYPRAAQERQYDAPAAENEREKVRRQAAEFEPDYLLTKAPTASDGAPVILDNGFVLGGNSRTMTLELVYADAAHPERAQRYRQQLTEHAAEYGVSREAVEGMEQPVLVRVLDRDITDDGELARMSNLLNQNMTEALSPLAEGVSGASRITEQALEAFAKGSEPFTSTEAFLKDADASAAFVAELRGTLIPRSKQAVYLEADGSTLTPAGRELATGALRALVVNDYGILSAAQAGTGKSALACIDRALPELVRLKEAGGSWAKIAEAVKPALQQIVRWTAGGKHKLKDIESHFAQGSVLRDAEKDNALVQALAITMAKGTPVEFRTRIAAVEAEAKHAKKAKAQAGMMSLLGKREQDVQAAEAFTRAFLGPVALIDGRAIRNYNPANVAHAAQYWAGTQSKHTVGAAQEALRKTLADPEREALEKKLQDPAASQHEKLRAELAELKAALGKLGIPADEQAAARKRLAKIPDLLKPEPERLQAILDNPKAKEKQKEKARARLAEIEEAKSKLEDIQPEDERLKAILEDEGALPEEREAAERRAAEKEKAKARLEILAPMTPKTTAYAFPGRKFSALLDARIKRDAALTVERERLQKAVSSTKTPEAERKKAQARLDEINARLAERERRLAVLADRDKPAWERNNADAWLNKHPEATFWQPGVPGVVELNVATATDEEGRAYILEEAERWGFGKEAAVKLLKDLDKAIAALEAKVREAGGPQLAEWLKWQEKPLRRVISKVLQQNVPVVSAFKTNGEYPVNFDLSTLCVKRAAADEIFRLAMEAGLFRNMGPTQIEALKDLLRAHGYLVACDACFVEARRVRMFAEATKTAYDWESVRRGAGILDAAEIGFHEELTDAQKQILREMTDRRPSTKYPGKKKFYEAWEKYIVPLGRGREYSLQLAADGSQKLDKNSRPVFKAVDAGTSPDKMAQIAALFLEQPKSAGFLRPEQLTTSSSMDALIQELGTSFRNLLAGFYGASTSKPVEGFNAYDPLSWRPIERKGKGGKRHVRPEAMRQKMYDIAGARAQSFSDFNPLQIVDYMEMFLDLALRAFPLHTYCKVPALPLIFGKTGAMINMSLVPEVVETVDLVAADGTKVAFEKKGNARFIAGLKVAIDGNDVVYTDKETGIGYTYAWHVDSFPVEQAYEIRKRKDFGGRVGTIAVGVSDEQILAMLDDERIDQIIPYHGRTMPEAVQIKTGLDKVTKYDEFQITRGKNAKKAPKFDALVQKIRREKLKAGESVDDVPREAAKAYLDWCDANGCTPMFEMFRSHRNYYKLLSNFRCYDNDGIAVFQGPVRFELTDDFAEQFSRAFGESSERQGRISGMVKNKALVAEMKKILTPTRLDGEHRTLMMQRLRNALGTSRVASYRRDEFFNELEKAKLDAAGPDTAKQDAVRRQVETFRNSRQYIYGFSYKGRIVLNEALFNAGTPAHEFAHVWAKVTQAADPKLWAEGKRLLKKHRLWKEVLADPLYEDIRSSEDAVASEVLARLTGKWNDKFIRGLLDPSVKHKTGAALEEEVSGALGRLEAQLRRWWQAVVRLVGRVLGFKAEELGIDEFGAMPLLTLWDKERGAMFRRTLEKQIETSRRPGLDAEAAAELGGPELSAQASDRTEAHVEEKKDASSTAANKSARPTDAWQKVLTFFQGGWTGSPAYYDRPSLDYVGSGEGQQIHGYGLYIAEDPQPADVRYRERLSVRNAGKFSLLVDGKEYKDAHIPAFSDEDASGYMPFSSLNRVSYWTAVKRQVKLAHDNKNWSELRASDYDAALAPMLEFSSRLKADRELGILKDILAAAKAGNLSAKEAVAWYARESKKIRYAARGGFFESGSTLDPFAINNAIRNYAAGEDGNIDPDAMEESVIAPLLNTQSVAEEVAFVAEDIDWDKAEMVGNIGQLMKVEVPENDVLLDEQKPLDKQPEPVRKALERMEPDVFFDMEKFNAKEKETKEKINDKRDWLDNKCNEIAERLQRWSYEQFNQLVDSVEADNSHEGIDRAAAPFAEWARANGKPGCLKDLEAFVSVMHEAKRLLDYESRVDAIFSEWRMRRAEHGDSGSSIYDYLSRKHGSDKAASLALNAAGVKGITYVGGIDGRCFVIFDDKAIKVLNIYRQEALARAAAELETKPDPLSTDARGCVTAGGDGNFYINLFKNADMSTILHESAHTYFLSMERHVESGLASEEMRNDWRRLREWAGLKEGQAVTVDEYRAFHEKLATAFEKYLAEGRAPAKSLQHIFRQIRTWMLKIYGELLNLGVEINDDVRDVFDRMLATRAEIETVRMEENPGLTQEQMDSLGLSPEQQAAIRRAQAMASDEALDRLFSKRQEWRNKQYEKNRKRAEKELENDPARQALADIADRPLERALVVQAVGEDMAAKLEKHGVPMVTDGTGSNPEDVAAMHRYTTPDVMLNDLANLKPWDEAVAARVKQLEEDRIDRRETQRELWRSMTQAEQTEAVAKALAEKAGRGYIPTETIRKAAAMEHGGMSIAQALSEGKFREAARRELEAERRAIARKDAAGAYEANTRARLNLEWARLAGELSERVEGAQKQAKKFLSSKEVKAAAKALAGRLIQNHQFLGESSATARNAERAWGNQIGAWEKQLQEEGTPLQIDDAVRTDTADWKSMTANGIQDFLDALKTIQTVERGQRQLLTSKRAQDLDTAAAEIEASLEKHNAGHKAARARDVSKLGWFLRGAHAWHMKPEQMLVNLEAGDTGGAAWTYIYKPLSDAADAESIEFQKAGDAMTKIFNKHFTAKDRAGLKKKSFCEPVGMTLTMEERLCCALNYGNAGNRGRLMRGFGWNDAQLAAVVAPLEKRHWEFVQDVWDFIESYRDRAFDVDEKVYGVRPVPVEAEPFMAKPADGPAMPMKGGYYPVAYDPRESSAGARVVEKAELDLHLAGTSCGTARARRGAMKLRGETGLGVPLRLDLGVLSEHVRDQIHMITHQAALADVARVLKHKKVAAALEKYLGVQGYGQFLPWLQDIANAAREPASPQYRIAKWGRAAVSLMMMGYKVTTAIVVPIGATQTIDEIGYGWTMTGYGRLIQALAHGRGSTLKLWNETKARSRMMETRIKTFDREVSDICRSLDAGPVSGWVNRFRRNAFVPMGFLQLWSVDIPTWWGAWEKKVSELRAKAQAENIAIPDIEEQANEYADSVVRRTQASGATKDLARVQRGSELSKMFTIFYSFFSTLYNLGATRIDTLKRAKESERGLRPSDILHAANHALLLWFLAAVLSELIAGRGPDEDEEWWKWCLRILLTFPAQSVVGLRDVVNAIFTPYEYDVTPISSAIRAIVKSFKTVDKAIEERDPSLLVKPTVKAAGYAFKLPLQQPLITAGNLWDFATDPASEWYWRDLVFAKPKSRQNKNKRRSRPASSGPRIM